MAVILSTSLGLYLNIELKYSYIMQCGLNLSLFVDQPTISSISNDKVVSENGLIYNTHMLLLHQHICYHLPTC
jgi:hypothetical protein